MKALNMNMNRDDHFPGIKSGHVEGYDNLWKVVLDEGGSARLIRHFQLKFDPDAADCVLREEK